MEKLKFSDLAYGRSFTLDKDQEVYFKVLDIEPSAISRSTKKRIRVNSEQLVNTVEHTELQ